MLAKKKERTIKLLGSKRPKKKKNSKLINAHSETAVRGCLKLGTILHKPMHKG